MQSPLARVRFLIYLAFLAAAAQECEAVCAPAALSDLRAGLWCLQALGLFMHVCLVRLRSVKELGFSYSAVRRSSNGIYEAMYGVKCHNNNSLIYTLIHNIH